MSQVREVTGDVTLGWDGSRLAREGRWRNCSFLTSYWREINHSRGELGRLPFAPPGVQVQGRGSQDYWVPPCSQVTW